MKKQLTFKKEDNKWYIDLPNWIGPHHALQMVCGADKMLDLVSQGQDVVTCDVTTSNEPIEGEGILLSRYKHSLAGDANYHTNLPSIPDVWLCPVTLFVYQRYPKYIFVAHAMDNNPEV